MAKLVIVESPAKAKTIEKYLGSDYKVTASMGHLRDLPRSTLGVDIADDNDPVRIFGADDLLEFDHGPADLLGVAAGTDVEMHVRFGDAEIDEKRIAHPHVVVLPGMDEDMGDLGMFGQFAAERRDLHEIGSRPDYAHNFHIITFRLLLSLKSQAPMSSPSPAAARHYRGRQCGYHRFFRSRTRESIPR